jgi:hypothetical protein
VNLINRRLNSSFGLKYDSSEIKEYQPFTVTLAFTQPLTEMNIRNFPGE